MHMFFFLHITKKKFSTNFSIKMYYLFQLFLTSVRISNFFRSWIFSSNYAYSAFAKPKPSEESVYIKKSFSPPTQLTPTLTFYSVTFCSYFLLFTATFYFFTATFYFFTATFYFSLLLLLLAIIFVYLLVVLTYFGKIFHPPTLLGPPFNHTYFSSICRKTRQQLFHRHPEKTCASWLTLSRVNF